MKALIIDTSSAKSFIALIEKEEVTAYRALSMGKDLSKDLFPFIMELLASTGTNIQEIACIAAGIGPGSYTGTRSGVSAAKALSFGCKIPFISFCSLLLFHPEKSQKFAITVESKAQDFFVLTAEKMQEKSWHYKLKQNVSQADLPTILSEFSHIVKNPSDDPQVLPNYTHLASFLYSRYLLSDSGVHNNLEIIYLHTTPHSSMEQEFIFDC
ncbi:MAG: tRNA (adenosine(37)-N6)-threonylcarbamoyltransferase complex dimerization subunit type 1 TsaB [Chlamydiae bacterium]|nr:tRNA (adenosine(37)-N6)-threonylcarbamoyltransferase complex dimerization subunit type 1 TsaB [Chlamydiota bacterium]